MTVLWGIKPRASTCIDLLLASTRETHGRRSRSIASLFQASRHACVPSGRKIQPVTAEGN